MSPDQPTHTPPASRMTGSSAVTSPPGLGRQLAPPSGPSDRSTGSLLATTTKSCCPAVALLYLCSEIRAPVSTVPCTETMTGAAAWPDSLMA